MNQLQVFEQRNVLGQELKIYGTQDDPLFLAKDVADWIEHNNITHMMNIVDDDEKLTYTIRNSGQNREMWFLTEDGMYEVLMQSRKPISKKFKKKVKNILKEIRKTGRYEEPKSPMEIMRLQFEALDETNKRVDTMEGDVEYLKKEVPLSTGEYNYISKQVNKAVYEAVDTFGLSNRREVTSELYKDINRGVNEIAGIKTRTQLKQRHFYPVYEFINQWNPSTAVLIKVRQLTLDLSEEQEDQS